MADAPDDLGIPMKPARPSMPGTTVTPVGKPPGMPPRAPDIGTAGVSAGTTLRAPEPPRRVGEPLGTGAGTPSTAAASRRSEAESRKLIVGREITLSGEITSCDKLVVEGSVEANLSNCRDVDIAESGLFKGSASIDEAEIRGRFEGNLVCRKRLMIKASGRVSGTIRYGQIEIECGGQISGDVQSQPLTEQGEIIDGPGVRAAM
jgi:cytoskeletal protein CcmA (bactofilin family)